MSPRDPASAWYRQPVLWLGLIVFVASMAGCVLMVWLGMHYADEPLSTPHQSLLGVQVAEPGSKAPP